ncbi:MAG: PD-(D/E)XK nuclease family protein [Elusimicrobia bacterium]|nr:PD-(D/E)XK nuclease family protein [Elusimicrobiota bacterium]
MNNPQQEQLTGLYNLIKDPNLAILESKLQEFNIFSILNLNRQEIRHSTMLAWLFNPQANHKLGTATLKELLLQLPEKYQLNALIHVSNLNPAEIEVSTESDAETGRIDILIKGKEFIIGIENKIDTTDAPGQLAKYIQYLKHQFPNKLRYFIYLTPEGLTPQELEDEIILLSYAHIARLIENLLISIPIMPAQVHALLLQYQQLILREITMEDNEIQELCSKLYKEHKEAIETILEYKMDFQATLNTILIEKFEKESIYRKSKCYLNFSPHSWEQYTCTQVRKGTWLKDCTDLVLFEIINNNKEIQIKLIVGPTDSNKQTESIKQKLLERIQKDSKYKKSGNKWTTIYTHKLLQYEKLKNATNEEIKDQFQKHLDQWLNDEYPKLVEQINEIMQQLQQDYERENAQ